MRFICGLLLSLLIAPGLSQGAVTVNMSALRQIESGGDSGAIGDHGKALGAFQIHKAVIDDFNAKASNKLLQPLSHKDVLRPEIGEIVANWYINQRIPRMLRAFGLQDSLENRLTAYNMGIKAVKKGKVAKEYIRRYKKEIKNNA